MREVEGSIPSPSRTRWGSSVAEHEHKLPGLVRPFNVHGVRPPPGAPTGRVWHVRRANPRGQRLDRGSNPRRSTSTIREGTRSDAKKGTNIFRNKRGFMSRRTPTLAAYTLHCRGFEPRLPLACGSSSAGRACSYRRATTTSTRPISGNERRTLTGSTYTWYSPEKGGRVRIPAELCKLSSKHAPHARASPPRRKTTLS
jgi:hypothetical protein